MAGPGPVLSQHSLRVGDLSASLAFYCGTLGMRPAHEPSPDRAVLSCGDSGGARLELRQAPADRPAGSLDPGGDDGYWKIGITLADVDVARDRLLSRGVEVSAPRQFRDIGYLCHLSDPDGFQIELLQHCFAANHSPQPPLAGCALGGPATLGQVTLRVRDIDSSLRFYRDRLGLALLSRQLVAPHGFTLYFLAGTDERPPHQDIDAVENREWLWQRPYTTLELQHRWGREAQAAPYRTHEDQSIGFDGITFVSPDHETDASLLDPDGNRVRRRAQGWSV